MKANSTVIVGEINTLSQQLDRITRQNFRKDKKNYSQLDLIDIYGTLPPNSGIHIFKCTWNIQPDRPDHGLSNKSP